METINQIELADESIYPSEEVLKAILGEGHAAYVRLLDTFNDHGLSVEWRYYHDGKAWLCKVQKKTRTIVWMSAWKGYIQATVYFSEKHLDSLRSLELSEETITRIFTTRKVGKSLPCIFEMRTDAGLPDFIKVMELKIRCR